MTVIYALYHRVMYRNTCLLPQLLILIVSMGQLGVGSQGLAEPISTSEKSIKPGINQGFLDANLNVKHWVEIFERESREVAAHRHAITHAVGLKPGVSVADIGAGTGLFVKLFAQEVGSTGQIVAVDIAPRFVDYIRKQANATGLTQVKARLGGEKSVELPALSIDVAFTCNTYHHFEYPIPTLASIHQALRPGGELIIVDFERIAGQSSDWVMGHVRAGKTVVIREIEAAGFRFVEESDVAGLEENYFLRFAKR